MTVLKPLGLGRHVTGAYTHTSSSTGSFKKYVVLNEMNSMEEELTVYESYASVLAKYHCGADGTFEKLQSRQVQWSDLRYSNTNDAIESPISEMWLRTRPSLRRGSRTNSMDQASENGTSTTALIENTWQICFEFLDFFSLQQCSEVCTLFKDITKGAFLWLNLYSRTYRSNQLMHRPYFMLKYPKLVALNYQRMQMNFCKLSTRGQVTVLPNHTLQIVNNSMLRSFMRGAIDSIRTLKPLPTLSCAKALELNIKYFEVTVHGCASVGIVQVHKDNSRLNAYGFGMEEHVGWKGISYGYHTHNGGFIAHDGSALYGGLHANFGPTWKEEVGKNLVENQNCIGCGWNEDTHEIFFTLNGEMIGSPTTCITPSIPYAAAVTLHALNDTCIINLGVAPFQFDIESCCLSVWKQ